MQVSASLKTGKNQATKTAYIRVPMLEDELIEIIAFRAIIQCKWTVYGCGLAHAKSDQLQPGLNTIHVILRGVCHEETLSETDYNSFRMHKQKEREELKK